MRKLVFIFLVSIFCITCKNEIDLLDNYKPALVCYGILNPTDTVHYVRISRVFLGEGSALEMAQVPDTTEFAPGTLNAKIERWLNGQLLQTFLLSPDTTIPREEGIFPSPHQVLYRGAFPVLQDGSTYMLIVDDLQRNISAKAETRIAAEPEMVEPVSINQPLNFENDGTIRFRFNTAVNGLRYDCRLRFYYTEQFIFDTTQVSEKYVEWYLGELTAPDDNGNHTLQITQERRSFLRMLSNNIEPDQYVRRIAGKIDFVFNAAAEDLVTYIEVQKANQTTSANIPPFTNVSGGIGLFSSLTTSKFENYIIDLDTKDALRLDPITQPLNFIR
jgi:hypothetical protein